MDGTVIYPEGDAGGRIPGVYTMDELNSAYQQMQQPAKTHNKQEDADDAEDYPARVRRMNWAERAYHGRLPKPFKVKEEEQDLNLQDNRLRPIVNTGASLLFGRGVTFTVRDAVEKDASGDLGDALKDVWDANRQAITLNKLGIIGGKFGHVFIKVVDKGVIRDGASMPRLVILDPRQVDVELDPDDVDTVKAFNYYWASRMKGPDGKPRDVVRRQHWERTDEPDDNGDPPPLGSPEHWRSYNQVATNVSGMKDLSGTVIITWDDVTPPVDWPYPWSPIHHCQNLPETSRLFGSEDITPDLIRLQEELNFCLSNIKTIQYFLGNPLLWARGINANQISRSPDNILIIESETGELNKVDLNGDISQHQAQADDIRLDMEELSSIPSWMLGRLKEFVRGNMPGITLRTSAAATINKTTMKQELYGDMLNTLNTHMLEMMDKGAGIVCDTIWQDILPVNETEWAATAPVAEQMGASHKQLLGQIGLDYDQERQQREIEAQDEADDAAKLGPDPMDMMDPNNPAAMMGADPNDPNATGTDNGPLTTQTQDAILSASNGTAQTAAQAKGLRSPAMRKARASATAAAAKVPVKATKRSVPPKKKG